MNYLRMLLLTGIFLGGCAVNASDVSGPIKVEIVPSGSGYQLLRGGEPYLIKGAGMGDGDIISFAAHGGNSIRNWGTENAQQVLDAALASGVTVALCLGVKSERQGFDYDDDKAIVDQLERLRLDVLKYRDHPALLAWIIGNELNWNYSNSKVYDAVNDISKMIHELDPNHPTTTTVAGFGENVVFDLDTRAPDLDIISFQVYEGLKYLPDFVQEADLSRPVWITEWGAIGHWEVDATSWGAPIEMNSSEKARVYLESPGKFIEPLGNKVIGTYAFLWGQKQETTSTWFGLFTESGEETESVDAMHWHWNGEWPANRSPALTSLQLDGKSADQNIELTPGQTYGATVEAADPDGDELSYHWEIKPESNDRKQAGDFEANINNIDGLIGDQGSTSTHITTSDQPGPYRLFVYAYDGNNHAAHANIPFLVKEQ
ncbi:MAG: hypothetical protein ACI9H8_000986 [Lysobacterales bacterium]|jgi:hypothetical protein